MLRLSSRPSSSARTSTKSSQRKPILRAGFIFLASSCLMIPVGFAQNAIQGQVLSGSNPVTESLVVLLGAGVTGYGSTPAVLDIGASGANGKIVMPGHFTCPAAPKDQVYLVAFGGNSGSSGYNPNLLMMTGLGSCANLTPSTFVTINEVTTVASAYALSAFMTSAPLIGTSATNVQGLDNAFLTINNLVNTTTGQSLTITPAYASSPVQFLNSSTVPQARIDTLANILAGCVNSSGSFGSSTACSTLFTDTTPTGGTEPENTLQAVLNVAQHPGMNVATLYGLTSVSAPYQPALTAAPSDFQLALTYTGGGLGLSPVSGVGNIQDSALALDAAGNVLVTAYGVHSGGTVSNSGMVVKFNNQGAPLTPATVQPTPTTVTYGGYLTKAISIEQPGPIALDQSGNSWISDLAFGHLNALTPGLTPLLPVVLSTPGLGQIASLAIDGLGNVWGGQDNGAISEYSGSGALLSPSTGFTGGGSYGNNYYGFPFNLTFDSTGQNLWASDNQFGDLYRVTQSNGQLAFDYFPTGGEASPVVAGASGNVYACPSGPGSIQMFNASSNTPIATYPTSTGRGCGGYMTVDGAGNIWVSSDVLDEYSSTGVLLSPAKGFTATSPGEPQTFPISVATAVDGSGNLWVLNGNTGDVLANSQNVLVEVVGTAAPVVTPKSVALADGKDAVRP